MRILNNNNWFLGLKQAIDSAFDNFIPRGNHPFVYVSLQMESTNVDVNIHPTKHEVKFLHEYDIMDKIKVAFENALAGSNQAKKFYIQQLLPGATDPLSKEDGEDDGSTQKEKAVYDRYLVRSDFKEQKLEKFFGMADLISASQLDTAEPVQDPMSQSISNFDETADSILEPIPMDVQTSQKSSSETDDGREDASQSSSSQSLTPNPAWRTSLLDDTIRMASSHNPFRVTRRKK